MAIMGEVERQQRHCILLYKMENHNVNLNGNLKCRQTTENNMTVINNNNTPITLCNGEKIG